MRLKLLGFGALVGLLSPGAAEDLKQEARFPPPRYTVAGITTSEEGGRTSLRGGNSTIWKHLSLMLAGTGPGPGGAGIR